MVDNANLPPDQILEALARNDGPFPEAALKAALAQPDALKAGLLEILSQAAESADQLPSDARAHRHAMVLLAAWREPDAFGSLLKFLALPSELVDHVLGETLDHLLARSLASTCQGRTGALKAAVENDGFYDYCRIAALRALKILMLQGELERRELVSFYRQLISRTPKRIDAFPWDMLVREINEIHPGELEADIRNIFAAGLINPYFLREEHMEVDLATHPEQRLEAARLKPENRLIEDPLTEISRFAVYVKQGE